MGRGRRLAPDGSRNRRNEPLYQGALPTSSRAAARTMLAMLALVKKLAEPGLWLEDVPEPEHGLNDVLIKVRRTGICGTDLHIQHWDAWAERTIPVPMTIGHEFVGEIVAVGSNVSDFHPGDVVSGEGHVVCGRCRNCMAGRRPLCAHPSGVGVNRPGAFAELIALPMTNIWHHADGIDLDVAAIFDPFGNAVHTALQFPVLGEDVLVTGAGPIGCMAAAVVRHAGARHVVVTDLNPYRLELARRMGATLAVDPREHDLADVQRDLGMTEGFDIGLEMSGAPDALHAMVANMSHGGRIAVLGLPSEEFALDWSTVITNMLTLRGVYGREMYETWYQMTVLLQSGLDITPVITHRFSFRDYEEAFATAASGDSGKIVMSWEDV
jgi:threonine 3-dehydrogenase